MGRIFGPKVVTPDSQVEAVRLAIQKREQQTAKEQRQASIDGSPNGLSCPRCGADMGDLPHWSMAGASPNMDPVGKIVHSSRRVGCSKCEYEAWRVAKLYRWTGDSFEPVRPEELGLDPSLGVGE